MKIVTIKDIAREVGAAPSTVSTVLNGKAREMRISVTMAERIEKAAAEMGYRPNHVAVSLRTGKSKVLGLIVEDISNVFFASLAKIIEEEADSIGYKVLYCSTENNEEKARDRIRMLAHHQVDGFLLTPTEGMKQDVQKIVAQQKPLVLMDRYYPGLPIPYVLVDNYRGVSEGMEHLFNKGYRKIAFVTNDLNQVQMVQRKKAYEDAMDSRKLSKDGLLLEMAFDIKPEKAVTETREFIGKLPELDAVFFATNYLGVYGLEAIKALELRIPADLAVICFDDNDIFRLYTPGITIIKQPMENIARTAMELLMRQFDSAPYAITDLQVKLPATLIERQST
jgi:LacI family transcriptional regulator